MNRRSCNLDIVLKKWKSLRKKVSPMPAIITLHHTRIMAGSVITAPSIAVKPNNMTARWLDI